MGAKASKNKIESSQSVDSVQSHHTSAPTVIVDGRSYHNVETSSYFLPRDEEEQDRLNSQHFSIKALYGGNILSRVEQTLPQDAYILDVGCGSGSWDMAIDFPNSRVIGLDMMDMFPTMIRPENVIFELVNVLDGIPYPDNTFDFVHMRLMLSAFRKQEWPLVITEIYRVLKPGGIVQLFESDFTEREQDPWIAAQLGDLLRQQSFENIELDLRKIDYGEASNPISKEMLWNWKIVFLALKPYINLHFNASSQEYDDMVKQFSKECHKYGWVVKTLAYFAQKPLRPAQ
ncbi:S-adenosyl-L-methionine-dependent methyltransferase [Phycomyces blakesleeanus]